MKKIFLITMLGAIVSYPAPGAPKIQFETNFFDFGHLSGVEAATGVFKLKNVGDEVLKIDPPEPSCGCTDAKARPDTLAPGQSGEITYKIRLDHPMNVTRKQIAIHSNDPKTPDVQLTMQLSYDMVYKFSTKELKLRLPPDKNEDQVTFTIKRDEEKPLGIDRFTTSREWITAAFDPSFAPTDSSAKVNVTVHRPPGPPVVIDATIEAWVAGETNQPARTINLTGEVLGELSASPPQLYWTIPPLGADIKNYPDGAISRKVTLSSVLGKPMEIKGVHSDIKDLNLTVTPIEAGKTYSLLMKFDKLPTVFSRGKITVESTLATMPRLEIPLTVAVFKP